MKKYYPDGDVNDPQNQIGISIAQTTIQMLKQGGNDLTRENIMKQAANLKNLELPLLLAGIKINTGPEPVLPDHPAAADQVRRQELGALRQRDQRLLIRAGARRPAMVRQPAGRSFILVSSRREVRMHIRKILTFVDEARSEAGQPAQTPLRKVASVAVVKNPFAGKYQE